MNIMKDLTKTEEILLLSIWHLGKEAYGFKIRHHVSEILGKDFTYGNLYCALQQLTVKKYVDKHPGESTKQRQGKIRMYYSLTPLGHKALAKAYDLNLKLWDRFNKYALGVKSK